MQEDTSQQAPLSALTFSGRLKLENGRRVVGAYRASKLGSAYGERKVKKYERPTLQTDSRGAMRQEMNAVHGNIQKPTGFQEPPKRGFNPYS